MNTNKLIRILCVLLLVFLARLFVTKGIPFLSAKNISLSKEILATLQETSNFSTDTNTPDYVNAFPELYAYKETFISTSSEIEKIAYLTFDDGPSKNTEKILDTLKKYNAKATFFVIGDNLTEEKINYMKRAIEEGHMIGLHTYSHDYNKIYSSVTDFLSDYDKLRQVLLEALNYSPTIFRFPGGSYCSYSTCIREELISEMTRRGYTYYDWNVSAEDSVGTVTAYSINKNIFPKIYDISSPVILMHDSASNRLTAELLPDIIEELQLNGYSFETLELREPLHFGE